MIQTCITNNKMIAARTASSAHPNVGAVKERFMRLNKFLTQCCILLMTVVLVLVTMMAAPRMQPPVAAQSDGKTPPPSLRPSSKLSDDLQKRVGQMSPSAEVAVILQSNGKPS